MAVVITILDRAEITYTKDCKMMDTKDRVNDITRKTGGRMKKWIKPRDALFVYMIVNFLTFLTMGFNDITTKSNYFNLIVSSLNCLGIKSNMGYTKDLFTKNNVNFICDHWLYPHELITVQDILEEDNKWCFLQSSRDSLDNSRGRPFGGIGFVCTKTDELSYQIIQSDSDRMCTLRVVRQ